MMIWNNECRQMQRRLALWVGNDLPEHETVGLERHLAVCPHCRETHHGLRQVQPVLGAEAQSPAAEPGELGSVWSGVARQIRVLEQPPAVPGWHRWLPSGVLVAACVAVVAALLPVDLGMGPQQFVDANHRGGQTLKVPGSRVGLRSKANDSRISGANDLQFRVLSRGVVEPENYRNF